MSPRARITVAPGDGIGPEITRATLEILERAGADLEVESATIGEAAHRAGHRSGVAPEAWESLRRTRVLLKGPVTTPQGGGYKSPNVTLRKTLGLFANVRPVASYAPFVPTQHPGMDLVIVRENEEDLYAGIEHRQTNEVFQCLKLITRPGTERVIRYAFELARRQGRRRVTCMTKDNIMKMTDGLFHKVFDEIGQEYPDLVKDHLIIDIGTALVAASPAQFDLVVTPNLYGDILSDVAAQVAGSVGLAGSANVGEHAAMFEAVHGSAPGIAGKGVANPSGLLSSAILMLEHLGQADLAARVENAWLRTLEDGIHTQDLVQPGATRPGVGTDEFARAVIERLGEQPRQLRPARPIAASASDLAAHVNRPRAYPTRLPRKEIVGVDVFLEWREGTPADLAEKLGPLADDDLELTMITNRGVKVWPDGNPETFCTDHWRCRFQAKGQAPVSHRRILFLLARVSEAGLDFIKTENLCTFDGEPGFSAGQGQ